MNSQSFIFYIYKDVKLIGALPPYNENFVLAWALKEPEVRGQEPEQNLKTEFLQLLTPGASSRIELSGSPG